MLALLPQIYPRDFVEYFVRNYFRFLDNIFHTWLINFDIEPFYKLINELDPDLKFIFEKLTTDINFLDINIKKNHPEKIINYSFTKSFQPKNNKEENKEIITFTRTYNPNHNFNYNRFNNCFNNINNRELRETCSNKKVLLRTRQPKNLKNMLVTAKFDLHPELPNRKPNGLFSCTDCIYHKNGYIKPCKSFTFKLTNGKSVTWN